MKLLCNVGWHRWFYTFEWVTLSSGSEADWFSCSRCGTRRLSTEVYWGKRSGAYSRAFWQKRWAEEEQDRAEATRLREEIEAADKALGELPE